MMMSQVRGFLAVEAVSFLTAALVHSGRLLDGHAHSKAATAETVIGAVLLGGLLVSLASPRSTRSAALAAQGFALLGTCVGILTIVIGIGPRTLLDAGLHTAFIALLTTGLLRARRMDDHAIRHA
jgi:hypothetical protein